MQGRGYNLMRADKELLDKHVALPPSFSIHFYLEHWTLNNGPNFPYTNQISTLLDDIRAFRIPSDFLELFDESNVRYYDGCLIVELLDYRPSKAKEPLLETPDVQRVVLRQTPETLWADLCLMNRKEGMKWTDTDALKVEAGILLATAPPLCLTPDPHLLRIVNTISRVSTPNSPPSLKRKAAVVETEEDETEKAQRLKILQFMNPVNHRPTFTPSFKTLLAKERAAAIRANQPQEGVSQLSQPASTHPSEVPGNALHVISEKPKVLPAPPPHAVSHAAGPPASYNTLQVSNQPNATLQTNAQHPGHQQNSPSKQSVALPGPSPRVANATLPKIAQGQPVQQNPPPPTSHSLAQIAPAPAVHQQGSQQPSFQPPIPSTTFLQQPPPTKQPRKTSISQGKIATPAMQPQQLPSAPTPQPVQQPQHPQYVQQQGPQPSQQHPQPVQPGTQPFLPRHMQQIGRTTPQPGHPGGSPMLTNQQLPGRSSPAIPNSQGARASPTIANRGVSANVNQNLQIPVQGGQQPQARPGTPAQPVQQQQPGVPQHMTQNRPQQQPQPTGQHPQHPQHAQHPQGQPVPSPGQIPSPASHPNYAAAAYQQQLMQQQAYQHRLRAQQAATAQAQAQAQAQGRSAPSPAPGQQGHAQAQGPGRQTPTPGLVQPGAAGPQGQGDQQGSQVVQGAQGQGQGQGQGQMPPQMVPGMHPAMYNMQYHQQLAAMQMNPQYAAAAWARMQSGAAGQVNMVGMMGVPGMHANGMNVNAMMGAQGRGMPHAMAAHGHTMAGMHPQAGMGRGAPQPR